MITAALLCGFCLVLGGIGLNLWITRKIRTQTSLALKTMFLTVKELKSNRESFEKIRVASQATAEYQRKSTEHQRVLLSSLNRQLVNLDAHLKSKTSLDSTPQEAQPKVHSGQLHRVMPSSRDNSANHSGKSTGRRIPLGEMITPLLNPGSQSTSGQQPLKDLISGNSKKPEQDSKAALLELVDGLSKLAKPAAPQEYQDMDARRISNG